MGRRRPTLPASGEIEGSFPQPPDMERIDMSTSEHSRSRGRLVRTLLLAATLTGTSVFVSPIASAAGPDARGVPGCGLTPKKPGMNVAGTKAQGRFTFFCIVGNLPFEYKIAVWEQDAGADQSLSVTGWLPGTLNSSGTYNGLGPRVLCNTEGGNEELYTRVRVRVGGASGESSVWESSGTLTTRTCQ